jgi:hypothetical protein
MVKLERLYSYLRDQAVFYVGIAIFTLTTLYHSLFTPVLDSWFFISQYQDFASAGILLRKGHEHASFIHTIMYGILMTLDSGDCRLIYLINIALAILGVFCLRIIFVGVFGERLSSHERNIYTCLLCLNPIFMVSAIQTSPDFALTIFFITTLAMLFTNRFFLASLSGIFMVFTKESGFVLYGLAVMLYGPLFIIKECRLKEMSVIIIKNKKTIFQLTLPLVLFITYSLFFPMHPYIGGLGGGLKTILTTPLFTAFSIGQLASLFIINFSWILAFVIIYTGLRRATRFFYRLREGKNGSAPRASATQIYFYIFLIAGSFLMTRITATNNPRYIMPILPLFIIVFVDSLIALSARRWVRILCAGLIITLIYASAFRTFDPVAKRVFGTFNFGKHKMLAMARFSEWLMFYYGRDELIYNFEFMYLPILTEKIIDYFGYDKIYAASDAANWVKFDDVRFFDANTLERTVRRGKDVTEVTFMSVEDILKSGVKEIYFIVYPNVTRKNTIKHLLRFFTVEENMIFDECGYELSALRMERKAATHFSDSVGLNFHKDLSRR